MFDKNSKEYKLFKSFLVAYLISALSKDKKIIIDIKKDIPIIESPSDLDDILHELKWELDDSDENGCGPDVRNYYFNENYEFGLIMNYDGFYNHLKLYRTDIDDD